MRSQASTAATVGIVIVVTVASAGAAASSDQQAIREYEQAKRILADDTLDRAEAVDHLLEARRLLGRTNVKLQALLVRALYEAGRYPEAVREAEVFFFLSPRPDLVVTMEMRDLLARAEREVAAAAARERDRLAREADEVRRKADLLEEERRQLARQRAEAEAARQRHLARVAEAWQDYDLAMEEWKERHADYESSKAWFTATSWAWNAVGLVGWGALTAAALAGSSAIAYATLLRQPSSVGDLQTLADDEDGSVMLLLGLGFPAVVTLLVGAYGLYPLALAVMWALDVQPGWMPHNPFEKAVPPSLCGAQLGATFFPCLLIFSFFKLDFCACCVGCPIAIVTLGADPFFVDEPEAPAPPSAPEEPRPEQTAMVF